MRCFDVRGTRDAQVGHPLAVGQDHDDVGFRRVGNRLAAATLVFDSYFGDAPAVVFAQRLVHPLPFIGLVLTLMARGWSRDKRKKICIAIYVVYMVPYIMVSYYIRYVVPLDIVKILFCLWGSQAVCSWVVGRPQPAPVGASGCGELFSAASGDNQQNP
jgi:hypothetical protein